MLSEGPGAASRRGVTTATTTGIVCGVARRIEAVCVCVCVHTNGTYVYTTSTTYRIP